MSRVLRQAKGDLTYLLFAEIYGRYEDPKAKRKAFAIIEATITCYARRGFPTVTMELIAREAGVSRALLKHYFDDMNEIRDTAFKYIRFLFQKLCVDEVKKATTPVQALTVYVTTCFFWADNFRQHYIVWWVYLLRCATDPKLRELHTQASQVGADRITNLLELGKASGSFYFNGRSDEVAKNIQTVISGALGIYTSENHVNMADYKDQTLKLCLDLAGVKV